MTVDSARQKAHYEAIHDAYEAHYYDAESMAYRERFFYDPLFAGLDLNRKKVADLASGSGHNSLAILQRFPTAEPTGFDISSAACAAYRRNVGRPAIECDLTKTISAAGEQYDVAVIVGGLHHCVAALDMAVDNVARIVKPGGAFLLVEPNRDCYLELVRRLWYLLDRKYFDAATEAALSHDAVLARSNGRFDLVSVGYMGGPGYFLISQSLLFRIPKRVKTAIVRPLTTLEYIYNRLPGRYPFPYFVARWRRSERT
jgi:SAM-dependent methyltransferase